MNITWEIRNIIKKIVFRIFEELAPFFVKKMVIDKAKIKKILIFQGGGIGDILLVFPAIESLHTNFPAASISVLVFPQVKSVFEIFPKKEIIAEIIDYDPEGIHKGLFKRLSLICLLRGKNFDLIYVPARGTGANGTILEAFLIGASHRMGFAGGMVGFLNTVNVEFQKDVPITKQNLSILKAAGLEVIREEIRVNIPEKEILLTKGLIGENFSFPLVSLHPGSVFYARYKSWPIENYISLIKAMLDELKAKVVLVGSKSEIEIGNKILKGVNGGEDNILNLIGKTTVPQMAGVIKSSHLFIGNDSGPLHIAIALKKPTVAIFGSTLPEQILSLRDSCTVVRKELPCSPCYVHEDDFKHDCKDALCLKEVLVSDVLDAVKKVVLIINLQQNEDEQVSTK